MATNAAFFVGSGPSARWVTTVWSDGYPAGLPRALLASHTAADFQRRALALAARHNVHGHQAVEDRVGWAEAVDGGHVDYTYFFARGRVWAVESGGGTFDPLAQHDAARGTAGRAHRPVAPRSAPRPAPSDDDAITRVMFAPQRRSSWSDSVFPGGVTVPQVVVLGLGVAAGAYVLVRLLSPSPAAAATSGAG